MGDPAPVEEDIASSCILDLDDASLCAVFSWINAQELAAVAICCQRFRTASRGNPLWLQLLSRDFGLALSSTASAGAAAAVGLYKQLLQGSRKQRALPCRAVCTDGGCDAPDSSTYWADNMFRYTVGELYCTDAATRNVHVLARLLPNPAASAGTRKEVPLPELGQTPEAMRQFIFDRCLSTAKELVPAAAVSGVTGRAAEAKADTAAAAGAGAGSDAGPSSSNSSQQQQQQGGVSSGGGSTGGGGGFPGMLGFWWGRGQKAEDAVSRDQSQQEQRRLAAAAALESCSTRGLCDLFAESYHACQQGDSWALGLFKGVASNADVHKMHVLMFALWSEHAAGRNGGLTLRRWRLPQRHQLPAPPLPASSPAAAAGVGHGHESVQQQAGYQLHTSPAAAAGHGQQQQSGNRELLCDEEQLLLLGDASLANSSSLVQEVWVARGKGSTCPLSTGIIYFGCQQQQQQQQTPSLAASAGGGNGSIDSSSGGVPTAAGPAARGAGAAGAAAPTAAAGQAARDPGAALSQQLGHTLQQPWVTVTDGLNSAAAVFAAAEAGQLPAVLDYAAGSSAEWIEFEKPTQSELQQQQQHRLAAAGSSIGSSQLSGVVFFPVLWFRFKSGLADQHGPGLLADGEGEEEEDEEEEEEEGDGDFNTDDFFEDIENEAGFFNQVQDAPLLHLAEVQAAAAAAAGELQGEAGALAAAAGGVGSGGAPAANAAAAAAPTAIADDAGLEQQWQEFGHLVHAAFEQQQQLAVQQQQQQTAGQGAAGQPAEAAGGAGEAVGGVGAGGQGGQQQGPAAAAAAASSVGPAVSDPTAAAAEGAPVPRQAVPWPVCAANPALPGAAPEAAAALGWYPSQQQPMSLAVCLQRPRLAQLLCVKLVDSEDCSPEFNASRGGCNVDCELVMVRGQDLVGVVPQGVVLTGAACL